MDSSLFQQIKAAVADGATPGSVVTLFANGSVETFAYGNFSDAGSPAATAQTVYDVASITKLFTATLILQAHQKQRLSIYEPCKTYLDNFHASGLRLLDLLTHQVAHSTPLHNYRHAYPEKAALKKALLEITPPAHGAARTEYSDLNFIYLGWIIEKATGKPLYDAMTELFQALHLDKTYTGIDVARLYIATPPTEVINKRVIRSVTHDETARMFGGLAGHAGIFSTAENLTTFGRAWLDTTIIKSDELRRVVFQNYDPSGELPQAIGWWIRYNSLDGPQSTPGVFSQSGFTGPFLAINPTVNKACALTCNRTYYGRDNSKHRAMWQLLVNWISS